MARVGWEEQARQVHRCGLQTHEMLFLQGVVANIPAGWSSAWNGYFLMSLLSKSPGTLKTHLECSELGVLSKSYQRLPAQAQ